MRDFFRRLGFALRAARRAFKGAWYYVPPVTQVEPPPFRVVTERDRMRVIHETQHSDLAKDTFYLESQAPASLAVTYYDRNGEIRSVAQKREEGQ